MKPLKLRQSAHLKFSYEELRSIAFLIHNHLADDPDAEIDPMWEKLENKILGAQAQLDPERYKFDIQQERES